MKRYLKLIVPFEKKTAKKRRWKLLQVEPSIACNLQCIMCPWKKIRKQVRNCGDMSTKVWEAIRPYLSETDSVDFTGSGEPLLQPELTKWIEQAKSQGCKTRILTNGLLLNKKTVIRLISAAIDLIAVSMDGASADVYEKIRKGSDFDQVCTNLATIANLRIDKTPKTMINKVTITKSSFTPEQQPMYAHDPRTSLFIRYDGVVSPCINLAYGGDSSFLGKELVMPSVHYGTLPNCNLIEMRKPDIQILQTNVYQQRTDLQPCYHEKSFSIRRIGS